MGSVSEFVHVPYKGTAWSEGALWPLGIRESAIGTGPTFYNKSSAQSGTVVEHGRLEGVRQGSARVLGGFGKRAPRPSGRVGFCPPGGRSGAEIPRGSSGKGPGVCFQVEEGGWAGG